MFFKKNNIKQPGSKRNNRQSNPVAFSYYAKAPSSSQRNTGRNEDRTSYIKKLGHRFRVSHIPSYIALVSIVTAIIYSSILQTDPRVTVINVPGSISRSQAQYQEIIQNEWKSSILYRSKLTVSTTDIRNNLSDQLTEIEKIEINLPLIGHRPKLVLTPAKPQLKYISTSGSFYVSSSGYVLANSTAIKENTILGLPEVHDETDLKSEPGKQILTEVEVRYLNQLHRLLTGQNLKVKSMSLPKNAANEVDIRLEGVGYYIKFSTLGDVRQGVGSYLVVKSKLDAEGKIPQQYVDVRVDEKVFVK